ncbi:Cytochrome monooxygenase lcsI [Penicillium chermesinum]|uniref:Cytochrome monooxygenase lcsI n=1 Tax=Penicillium chermesinum TaxID=63820 RepID=A0A9W9U082_9EURO|nr:Cytochrome monooxygenase lcsI [Penicillium chermesinum]KAJ5248736.1 Cytochrome monooxygenase lcsI [Penicillium chermesinum]KAJ6150844.1 Cytochrome monooxygenase lcsI [Penicillium chermesinum]
MVPQPSKAGALDDTALLLGVGAVALLAYPFWMIIYNLYLSPLSKYPGPKLAAISDMPYVSWTVRGVLALKLKDLHEQYGDVVRAGPRRLVYRNAQAWRDIYGHRKSGAGSFMKDPEFYTVGPYGPNIINSNDADHSRQRRLFSHAFSEKALRDQEGLIQSYVDLLIRCLDDEISESRATTEMTKWLNFTTFDIIGDLVFGDPFDCLKNKTYHFWVTLAFTSVKAGSFRVVAAIYPFLLPFMKLLTQGDLLKRRDEFFGLSKEKMQRRLNTKTPRPDFMAHVLRHTGDKAMTEREMDANASVLIIAGSETTATLLSGFVYYVTTHPDVYQKVVSEVRGSLKSYEDISFQNINSLTYLLATLEESLRMYPPVPGLLPRVVPKGGALINGQFVPEGVSVAGAHFSTYRSASHFADAESFIPERWLPDREQKFESDQRDVLHPFSLGPRNCLGKNLAYAEMKLIAAKLLWSFDLTLDKSSIGWDGQQSWNIWEKKPLMVKLERVQR